MTDGSIASVHQLIKGGYDDGLLTRTKNCRSTFIPLRIVFFPGGDVMRVGIGRTSEDDVSFLAQDAGGDEGLADGFSVDVI